MLHIGGRSYFESDCIYLQSGIVKGDGVSMRPEAGSAQELPQAANSFRQRLPGQSLRGLGPQDANEVFARACTVWREGEVDQQRQVLAPEHLDRRFMTFHTRRRRSEADQG